MPNLDNLKKQAKQYLRWHRNQHYPVAAEMRAALPRFRQLDDSQIFTADFKLADAQERVTRQRGFKTWQALKAGVDDMTTRSKATDPTAFLSATEAQLFVANMTQACDFYSSKLGFAVAFIYGEPPYYGQVKRDNARLNLRCVDEPVFVGDIRAREHLLSATITLESAAGLKQMFLEAQAAGATFHQLLRTEPWGARTFVVVDPDGNLVLFAGPAE